MRLALDDHLQDDDSSCAQDEERKSSSCSNVQLRLLQTHQDQVLELPPCATLLASSPNCPVEMYAIGDQVLCMQVCAPGYDSSVHSFSDVALHSSMLPPIAFIARAIRSSLSTFLRIRFAPALPVV
jgi:hypothetical protein